MRKTLILALVLAVGVVLATVGSRVVGTQADQIGALSRTTLLHTGATGVETDERQPLEIFVYDVTIGAGGIAPRHYHPGNETFVVTQGTGVFQEDGKPLIALKPGVAVHIDPKKVHKVTAGAEGPLKIIDFGVYEAGQPAATIAK